MRSIAVYPGTFDPPTLGHLDVMERAARMFDTLIVAVGKNSEKRSTLLTLEQRIEALEASTRHLPNVSVQSFTGLLVNFAMGVGARTMVRGLRATADFDYEFQMAMVNRRLTDQVDTVFLMTKWEHSYLSSSIVREVAVLGGDFSEMVHPGVIPVVQSALAARANQKSS